MNNIKRNKLLFRHLCLTISLFTALPTSVAADDNDFYQAPITYPAIQYFKSIHSIADVSVNDDSQALQVSIDNLSKQGAG